MKKIIAIVSLVFIPGILWAQQANKNFERSGGNDINDRAFTSGSRVITFRQMDQRKIYHWATGQRATATGRQAGQKLPGRYVRVFGDSAVVVRNPVDKRSASR